MKKLFSLMLLSAAIGSVSAVDLTQGITHFKDQPYWGGKAKVITVDGKKVLELTSSVKGSRHFGRAFAIYSAKEKFSAQEKIIATAKVRGKGKFFIGILKYRPNNGMPITVLVEPIELTEQAKDVKFIFEMGDVFDRVFPFVQVQGEGIAYIESFKLEKTIDASLKPTPLAAASNNAAVSQAKPSSSANKVLVSKITSFSGQPYWGGKAKVVTVNGKKVLDIESTVKNGRHFGRAFAPFWVKDLYLPETKLHASVKVSGNGKFLVGLLKYRPKQGAPVSSNGKVVDLSAEAKEFKFDFEIEDLYEKVYPFLEVQGAGNARVESFKLEKIGVKNVKITAETPLQIIVDKQISKPVEFSTSVKNDNVYVVKFGKKNSVEKIKSNKDGNLTVPAAQYPLGTNHVYAASKGVGVPCYISVVSADEYAKSDAIARTIKLKKPIRVLFLGDSLSDYYRGYNYIDRVNFWLNKYNPGKFTFHNAGIGGDFLERASNRMEAELKYQKKWMYRQEMYKGIFKDEYDYVFLWLGQNDTRCMRNQGYKVPETTQEEQNKYLTLMLNRLKKHCPKAKVVLIAPSPSDEALFLNREKTWAKSRNIAFYGKTEFVNAYDAFNRQFCKKHNLDYIDMLTAMRSISPIKELYVSDGVHLSDKGGILASDEILKFFAGKFK